MPRLILSAAAGIEGAAARRAAAAAGGALTRLDPRACAVETPDADPARAEAARAALPEADVNPFHGPARLFLADMDSTVIACECIDEIADFAGVKPQVAAITERAMRGELDFAASLTARVALLEGVHEAALEAVWRERVRLNVGARRLVRTLTAQGVETALVSGGFTFFSVRVAEEAGFRSHRANRLEIVDGKLTGRTIGAVLGREAKLERLRALAAQIGADPADSVAVGDGANDLAMLGASGLGVAYRAKPAVAAQARARLEWSDLTAILHMMGVPAKEWATP